MSKQQLLDTYGNAGQIQQILIDERHLGGNYTVKNIEDTTRILKAAKDAREMADLYGESKEFKHAAYVPHFVYDQWLRDAKAAGHPGVIDKKVMKAWCNDPDNAMFRTWPGQL